MQVSKQPAVKGGSGGDGLCKRVCEATTTQGPSFPDLTAFSGDDFYTFGVFLCLVRSCGQDVPLSHLCPLVYCLSLHNNRDGINRIERTVSKLSMPE